MAYRDPVTGQLISENGTPTTTDIYGGSEVAASGAQNAPLAIGTQSAAVYTFRWLLAWAIAILLLSLANRTRIGHTLLYYLLATSLFFLIVTQYKWLAAALSPITGTPLQTAVYGGQAG